MKGWQQIMSGAGLAPIDRQLGALFARLAAPAEAEILAMTAALIGRECAAGHSCIRLDDWAGKPFPAGDSQTLPALPELAEWQQALNGTTLVGTGAEPTPLVRDPEGRVYFHRYWQAEQRLAEVIKRLAANPLPDSPVAQADPAEMFGDATEQLAAARTALAGRFTVITGGPGTGKTTTVVKILALVLSRNPELRIRLTAPTGKAAARLAQSIGQQVGGLPVADSVRAKIPTTVTTIHRLLGYHGGTDRFRYGPERRLACDFLVVDEASMVDLLLMEQMFSALPDTARVVLLGDQDQLASVASGNVLGDICSVPGLAPSMATLKRNYRFSAGQGIGVLGDAIRVRDAGAALEVLTPGAHRELSFAPLPAKPAEVLASRRAWFSAYAGLTSVEAALAYFADFRILTPHRKGPFGVDACNLAVESFLADSGVDVHPTFYRGRPVLIRANDYELQLYNGDTGIAWPDADGVTRVWFPGDEGYLRPIPPARLPAHGTAFAMTVHKSQGSEFESVLLVLPAVASPLCRRELIYTGATRARRELQLWGAGSDLDYAILHDTQRTSGLAAALMSCRDTP